MVELGPKHSFSIDSTTTNVYHADIGEGLNRHEHLYAHVTFCMAGKIAVRKEGKLLEMTKDTKPVLLKANEWHEIEAIEDGTVFVNVFAEGRY